MSEEKWPKVAIIVLNWNGWQDTIECLESLYQITYPNYEVIVVDNGSENESVEKIKEYVDGKLPVESRFFEYTTKNKPLQYFECSLKEAETVDGRTEETVFCLSPKKRLILIKNDKNYGFAEGNNIGIRHAFKTINPGYILLLNNDTVVDRNFLRELINVTESDDMIAFAGPKNYYYDYHGRTNVLNFAGGKIIMWRGKTEQRGRGELDVGQYDTIANVDFILGACLLARKEIIETIGLLDPVYFLYWEETDWCTRAKNAGYKLQYIPNAKIWHKIGASSTPQINSKIEYYRTRNRSRFVMKNGSASDKLGYIIYFFGYIWIYKIAASLLYYRDLERLKFTLKGLIDALRER